MGTPEAPRGRAPTREQTGHNTTDQITGPVGSDQVEMHFHLFRNK